MRRLVLLAPLLGLAMGASRAHAQDADGDGAPDAVDALPCDASASAVSFVPAEGQRAVLLVEDQWPAQGDLDFNDLVLVYDAVVRHDAAGPRTLTLTLDVAAIGGDLHNGLGLRLPTPRATVTSVTRAVAGGAPQAILPSPVDGDLTVALSTDLRELFADLTGPINSASTPSVAGATLVVEIAFADGATLDMGQAPWDVFLFRTNARGHELHRPAYRGTAAMDTALFGTADDGSTPTRSFVDVQGLPFVLELPQLSVYPSEATPVSALFPRVLAFAASGGQTDADFYTTVDAAYAYADTVAVPSAAPFTPDTRCVVPGGTSPDDAGTTCRTLLEDGASRGSGTYWINPSGGPVSSAFLAYCDMSTGGGGWTLIESLTRDHPAQRLPYSAIGFHVNYPIAPGAPAPNGGFRMSASQLAAVHAVSVELAATTNTNGFTRDYFVTRQGRDRMFNWGAGRTCYYCVQDQLLFESLNFAGVTYTNDRFSTWTTPGLGWTPGGKFCVDDPRLGRASGDFWGFNSTLDASFSGHTAASSTTHYWLR
jgi:LruC domain-containing protein